VECSLTVLMSVYVLDIRIKRRLLGCGRWGVGVWVGMGAW